MSVSSTPSPAGTTSDRGRRARVAARVRLDFWLDAVILVGYTVAYSYGWTGVVIHEWLGIGLGIALLSHLTLHWDWVVRTTRRLFSPRGRDKLIWLVNLALLLFAMTLCVASGIAISRVALPELGIGSGRPGLFPGDLLEPVNLVVLRNNAFLEAVVITAVVIVDASYRILRRARRART